MARRCRTEEGTKSRLRLEDALARLARRARPCHYRCHAAGDAATAPSRMYGTFILVAVVFAIVRVLLKRLHPAWWAKKPIRLGIWALFAMAMAGMLLRTWAMSAWVPGHTPAQGRHPGLAIAGVTLAAPGSVALLGLLLTLPLAALVRGVLGWLVLRRSGTVRVAPPKPVVATDASEVPSSGASIDPVIASVDATSAEQLDAGANARAMLPRRRLVELAAATLPLAALGTGAVGLAGAYAATRIIPRPMRFEGLAPELDGLKILQLTDLHVGAFMDVDGVAAIAEAAVAHRPDLVVLTGDICDHVPWLDDTLKLVGEIRPRLGVFAALGNHEHFRGLQRSVAAYEHSTVDLLMNEARAVRVGSAELVIAGVDDPGRGLGGAGLHYARTIDEALAGQPDRSFRLGLCHRPSGFADLADAGIDLQLSGHTHAGQIGVGERSIFEGIAPDAKLWGRYTRGKSQLYTSSGGGHWFAFRLACPSEAALVTLERA
jgi:predicted MPP superfamily phosphohydrolase